MGVKLKDCDARGTALLIMAFVALMVIVFCLLHFHVDGGTAVGTLLIMLATKFVGHIGTAFDFEFGDSRGARNKDATIAESSSASAATATAAATKQG